MDKDNLHLYDRFKSLERLQRVSATFTASNTSRSTCSNSNTPTTAYSTSRTELYFNCFFAIKIIVLSGFSLRFIFAIFSLCVSLFLPLCPYAICDVQFPLCLSSFACIFVHLPPPPKKNLNLSISSMIYVWYAVLSAIQFAREMENMVLWGGIFHLVTFLFPLSMRLKSMIKVTFCLSG